MIESEKPKRWARQLRDYTEKTGIGMDKVKNGKIDRIKEDVDQ